MHTTMIILQCVKVNKAVLLCIAERIAWPLNVRTEVCEMIGISTVRARTDEPSISADTSLSADSVGSLWLTDIIGSCVPAFSGTS